METTSTTQFGFSRPGGTIGAKLIREAIQHFGVATVRPHMQKERSLTQAQAEALEGASGESGWAYRIRNVAQQETSADSQRKAWASLIASAKPTRRIL